MKVSYRWLSRLLDMEPQNQALPNPRLVADTLTSIGLEVEEFERKGRNKADLAGLMVAEVVECHPHPNADRLKITKIGTGSGELLSVVCGAPNVKAGIKVVLAPVGTQLQPLAGEPFTIKAAKIRGEYSQGMLCAEDELGLGDDHDGIMVLPEAYEVGRPYADYHEGEEDWIYTLGITPNRMDALSHYGVARDLAAALNLKLIPLACLCREHSPFLSHDEGEKAGQASPNAFPEMQLGVENPDDCPRLAGLAIEGIKVGPSPAWLQEALQSIGLKPINNVVDVTNFIQFEIGQPLHAYDRAYLEGNHLGVRRALPGEQLTLLDQRTYDLHEDNLVVVDGRKAVGLAGVMGGAGDSIHPNTTHLYLESACFNPTVIRRSARRVALRSEASYRFERGTDPDLVLLALEYAAGLILNVAGGRLSYPIQETGGLDSANQPIYLRKSRLETMAGIDLDDSEVARILQALDFKLLPSEDESASPSGPGWKMIPPTYRRDVRREIDAIEEVLRIWGYNRIPIPSTHRYSNDYPAESALPALQNKISDWWSARGFHEFVGLSLVSASEFEWVCPDPATGIRVMGPVNELIPLMRPSLLLSGLRHLAHNLNRRQTNVMCYEIGRCYRYLEPGTMPLENEQMCLMVTGLQAAESWYREAREVDAAFLQGHLMDFLAMVAPWSTTNLQVRTVLQGSDTLPDPAVRLGAVDPRILEAFDIRQPVFAAFLDWTALASPPSSPPAAFEEVPKFPSIRRDLALVAPEGTHWADLEKIALRHGGPSLESLCLFDVYRGKGLPEGTVSYGVGLVFRHRDRTLNYAEIEANIEAMLVTFEKSLAVRLRR